VNAPGSFALLAWVWASKGIYTRTRLTALVNFSSIRTFVAGRRALSLLLLLLLFYYYNFLLPFVFFCIPEFRPCTRPSRSRVQNLGAISIRLIESGLGVSDQV
jgi:hypothetical protein